MKLILLIALAGCVAAAPEYLSFAGRELTLAEDSDYAQFDKGGCVQISRADSGFFLLGKPSGKGIQLSQCSEAGGCACFKPKVCRNGNGCSSLYKCTAKAGKNRCFQFTSCKKRNDFDTSIVINIPDSCSGILTEANYASILTQIKDSLLQCTPACSIGPDGPNSLEVQNNAITIPLVNSASVYAVSNCLFNKGVKIDECPALESGEEEIEIEEPDSGDNDFDIFRRGVSLEDGCDCQDFEGEPHACSPHGIVYDNSCIASCVGVYASPLLC